MSLLETYVMTVYCGPCQSRHKKIARFSGSYLIGICLENKLLISLASENHRKLDYFTILF